jgi:hypothetical protein
MFCLFPSGLNNLTLPENSIETYEPEQKFYLNTCVHAFYYIGDQLSVIRKAAQFLKKRRSISGEPGFKEPEAFSRAKLPQYISRVFLRERIYL